MCKTFDETFFLRSFYLKYKVHIKCKVLRHLHISKVFHLIVYASPTWTRTAQNQPVCNPYSIFCYIFPALHKGPYVHKNKHLDCPGWPSPYWIKLIWLYEGRLEPLYRLGFKLSPRGCSFICRLTVVVIHVHLAPAKDQCAWMRLRFWWQTYGYVYTVLKCLYPPEVSQIRSCEWSLQSGAAIHAVQFNRIAKCFQFGWFFFLLSKFLPSSAQLYNDLGVWFV